ncbi:MAG: GNAT family N-acetyltransferase [Spirochaetales bacterium]|nr:GNAT family N-acetyltransferase [Spirochaetales bacterium]
MKGQEEDGVIMDKVIIREMRQEDIPQVHTLLEKLEELFESGHDISLKAILATYSEMEKNKDLYKNYVAEINNRVCGFITAVFYKTFFHKGGSAFINELIVAEDLQGKGTGRQLVLKMKTLAKQMKINQVYVSTSSENPKAIDFYKTLGLADESTILGEELLK